MRTMLYWLAANVFGELSPAVMANYPGGAPMRREIECFSEYSEASMRIMASGESKSNVANY